MRILLLGATGRTGKLILEGCLSKGYQVNVLVRKPKEIHFKNDSLTVIEGTPESKKDVSKAIKGCTHIISALNISRINDFPWSGLRSPTTLLSDSMSYVLQSADRNILERIIVISAWGVLDSFRELPFWFRWLIKNSNIGPAYKDHEKQELLLKSAPVNVTVVRPSGLINFTTNKIKISIEGNPKPALTISRKAVAEFIANELSNNAFHNTTITVSSNLF